MKKFILCLTICLFILTGCGKEKVNLDLESLSEKITNLESKDFSKINAIELLNEKINDLEEVYNTKKTFGFEINSDDVEELNVAVNKKKTNMYFIVKPLNDKKDSIKKTIDKYIDSLKKDVKAKLSYEEYQDYLIYIIADNSNDLLKDVKNCHSTIFSNLMDIDKDGLSQTFDIDDKLVSEFLVKVPMMNVNANSVIILKPENGKTKEVKDKMNDYMTKLENQWQTYLPDQYELVKNRLEKEYGGYLIYIISNDNNQVFDLIKDSKK